MQYRYTKQTSKVDTALLRQHVFLVMRDNESMFFSEAAYVSDSVFAENTKNGVRTDFKNLPEDHLRGFVKKNLNLQTITYYSDEFDDLEFQYDEKPDFKWQITAQNKQVLGYKVFLAKTSYMGRQYSAYFTTEIPVSDGPYKFFGLPGLILEIFDDEKKHHFEAVGIAEGRQIHLDLESRKFKETDKLKFNTAREAYRKAPLQRLIQLMNSSQIYEVPDKNGDVVDLRKLFEENQRTMIKQFQNENNIEL
ncbi:hypothetical protein FIC_01963 [Flavobacteriaceae bacterium 3519-10]|nr:hypothetical protein FIC_01963 [Flavobacteriaceae bacterium 3519-10]